MGRLEEQWRSPPETSCEEMWQKQVWVEQPAVPLVLADLSPAVKRSSAAAASG